MKINSDIQLMRQQLPKAISDELHMNLPPKILKTFDSRKTCNTYKISQLNNNEYTLYNIESKIKIAGAPND